MYSPAGSRRIRRRFSFWQDFSGRLSPFWVSLSYEDFYTANLFSPKRNKCHLTSCFSWKKVGFQDEKTDLQLFLWSIERTFPFVVFPHTVNINVHASYNFFVVIVFLIRVKNLDSVVFLFCSTIVFYWKARPQRKEKVFFWELWSTDNKKRTGTRKKEVSNWNLKPQTFSSNWQQDLNHQMVKK